jgi:bifunctional enzyme CysN/CysC
MTAPGLTIWLTGLPGSGKTSVARLAADMLRARGRPAFVVDGDGMRLGLNADLGFSMADRIENQRRIAYVACLLAEAGLVVLVATISPLAAHRALARSIHERATVHFREVYVDTPLDVCERRDPKGLYAQARAGGIVDFTGIDSLYEAPDRPDLRLDCSLPLTALVAQVVWFIEETLSV